MLFIRYECIINPEILRTTALHKKLFAFACDPDWYEDIVDVRPYTLFHTTIL
jgi:hypothetical protein